MEAILKSIKNGNLDAEVQVVISNNPNAKGLDIAKEYGITTFVLEISSFPNKSEYEKEIVQILKGQSVDWVVLAGYMRLLGQDLLSAYENKIVNIHPSLLPSFKGLNAQKQALDYGVKYSGCTVHFVDQFLDSGPIILQAVVPVQEDDTVESLSDRILVEEHKLYPKAIQLLIEKNLQPDDLRKGTASNQEKTKV